MNDDPRTQAYAWVPSRKASEIFNVTPNTLRRWCDNNTIEFKRNPSGQRLYKILIPSDISKCEQPESSYKRINTKYIYCRVSSGKQKEDLNRQCQFLSDKYQNHNIIKDIGSGLNYKRKGLLRLLDEVFRGGVEEVVVFSKDRLCRFGFELIEWLLSRHNAKIVVYEQSNKSTEQQFTEDILAILQVFACRWNGSRKYKDSKMSKTEIEEAIEKSTNITS